MTLDQLQYFVEAARRQHIGQAARFLNISPSAISHSIAALEEEFGQSLFEKQGRQIRHPLLYFCRPHMDESANGKSRNLCHFAFHEVRRGSFESKFRRSGLRILFFSSLRAQQFAGRTLPRATCNMFWKKTSLF